MPCVLDEQRLKQRNALVVREDFAAGWLGDTLMLAMLCGRMTAAAKRFWRAQFS